MCPISPIVHCSSSSDDQHQKGQNGCSVGSAAGGGDESLQFNWTIVPVGVFFCDDTSKLTGNLYIQPSF